MVNDTDTPTKVKPGSALVTEAVPFVKYPAHGGRALFQVMPGLPLIEAVRQISCLLDALQEVTSSAVSNGDDISTRMAFLMDAHLEQVIALHASIEQAMEFQAATLREIERAAA